jgi:hypothetical protein
MSVLRSVRDRDAVASLEYLGAVDEFDLESAFEDLSDVTTLTPMRLELRRVFDETEPSPLERKDFVANSIHRHGPRNRFKITPVFHFNTAVLAIASSTCALNSSMYRCGAASLHHLAPASVSRSSRTMGARRSSADMESRSE